MNLKYILFLMTGFFLAVQSVYDVKAQEEANVPARLLTGLEGTVEIFRDEWGNPYIKAESDHDLFMGLGYAMAEDRLWQMDASRRLAQGHVAEVGGQDQLQWDVYHRTIGLGRISEESVDVIDPVTLDYMQAFSDGVNKYIDDSQECLPFEFLLMCYKPEPWKPVDTIAITRLVALWLSADEWDENMYDTLLESLDKEVANDLFRPVPPEEPDYNLAADSGIADCPDKILCGTTCEAKSTPEKIDTGMMRQLIAEWIDLLGAISQGAHLQASNIWAVDGSMTESGEPILAMDPHLNYFAPSILYEATLDGDSFRCWGVTFPGMPFFPFGANENIAWGASNFPADSADLYVEHLNPMNPLQYNVDGKWQNFEVIHERIPYLSQGGETREYLYDVYVSRHGPIVQQKYNGYYALRWTGLEPSDDMTSFLRVMKSTNIDEFYESFRIYHCPPQNFCVAENGRGGRVGQVIAGRVPIRTGYDGRSPVDGSDSSNDWAGYIPYDDLPQRLNPPEGFVAHANNLPPGILDNLPGDFRPLGGSFSTNHRINRIVELLRAEAPLTPEEMKLIQMDDLDMTTTFFVPVLMDAWDRTGSEYSDLEEYIGILSNWDCHLAKDSIGATIYQLWFIKLAQNCILASLPWTVQSYLDHSDRWLPVLQEYLEGQPTLPVLQSDDQLARDRKVLQSLRDAIGWLKRDIGGDPRYWQWGNINQAVFPHPSGETNMIGGGTHPWGGGKYTVRVGHYAFGTTLPFTNDFGAVFRAVAASIDGRWQIQAVLPPGESGTIFGPHGDDQMDIWLEGDMRAVYFENSEGGFHGH